jgi:hypothetical protein
LKLGHVLITSIKNEGPFIVEWVAHHRVMGFDHIFIASNDCSDGSDALLVALDRAGVIGHAPNVLQPGEVPQHAGYVHMRKRFGLDLAQWLMVLDVDEFLQVAVGQGRVQDLTAQAPREIDVIALCAMTFGTAAGAWHPGRVCERFQQRLTLSHPANRLIKSITRAPGRFRAIHNHSLVGFRPKTPLQVMRADRSVFEIPVGVSIWNRLRNFNQREVTHDIAYFNHYAIKTRDSFGVRKARGRGTAKDQTAENLRHTQIYFDDIAKAWVPDDTILSLSSQVQAEMDRILALPGVALAQANAEAGYSTLISALDVTSQ